MCLKQAITRVTTLHIIITKLNKLSYVTIETNPFHINISVAGIIAPLTPLVGILYNFQCALLC